MGEEKSRGRRIGEPSALPGRRLAAVFARKARRGREADAASGLADQENFDPESASDPCCKPTQPEAGPSHHIFKRLFPKPQSARDSLPRRRISRDRMNHRFTG